MAQKQFNKVMFGQGIDNLLTALEPSVCKEGVLYLERNHPSLTIVDMWQSV